MAPSAAPRPRVGRFAEPANEDYHHRDFGKKQCLRQCRLLIDPEARINGSDGSGDEPDALTEQASPSEANQHDCQRPKRRIEKLHLVVPNACRSSHPGEPRKRKDPQRRMEGIRFTREDIAKPCAVRYGMRLQYVVESVAPNRSRVEVDHPNPNAQSHDGSRHQPDPVTRNVVSLGIKDGACRRLACLGLYAA